MNKVRVGIVGVGFTIGIAQSHLHGYANCEAAEILAVYDKLPGRAEAFMKRHNLQNLTICETFEQLLNMVDAVSICTPNNTHAELAVAALKAGKHVLVEKPFSVDCATGEPALKAALAHPELVAMTGLNYRDFGVFHYMKEIVDSGELGRINLVRQSGGGGRIADPENVYLEWRMREATSGTGSLADFGAHMIDLADFILRDHCGKYVSFSAQTATHVHERYAIDPADAMGGKQAAKAPVTNDDSAAFSAVMENGALFVFTTSRMNHSGSDFEIIGENGAISHSTKFPPGTIGMFLKGKPVPGYDEPAFFMRPVKIPEKYLNPNQRGVNHVDIIGEFIDAIQTGKKPLRDFSHGMYIQSIIDNFSLAAKEGRIVKA